MKRWQIQGVVQDSDDEEFSQGSESLRSERPSKRIKRDEVAYSGNDGQSSHLEPAIAASLREVDHAGSQRLADTTKANGKSASKIPTLISDINNNNLATSYQTPSSSQDGFRIQASQRFASAKLRLELSHGVLTNSSDEDESSNEILAESGNVLEPPESSLLSEAESLPQPKDVLAGHQIPKPGFGSTRQSSPLSELSPPPSDLPSPLSEHQVSSPPGVPSLAQGDFSNTPALRPDGTNPRRVDHGTGFPKPMSKADSAPIRAGRSLRVRKEIQLHPYLVDRVQYVQQCRQRGIKPVRLMDQSFQAEETQSTSLDDEYVSREETFPLSSQATKSRSQHNPGSMALSLNFFDIADETLFPGFHPAKRKMITSDFDLDHDKRTANSDPDGLSLPPSPPGSRNGSESFSKLQRETDSAQFRLPFGMTPAPLPTPQISSETKPTESGSTSYSTRRKGRLSSLARRLDDVVHIDSSSDTSIESESEVENRRLRREQRQVRGVLPASWLKIDYRAQKRKKSQSPARKQGLLAGSPQKPEPQKGVARKVGRVKAANVRDDDFPFSDVDSDPGPNETIQPPSPELRQSRFDPTRDQLTITASNLINEDLMENNWIDPMLPGSTSSMRKQSKKRTRQPRITKAVQESPNDLTKFSEERSQNTYRHRERTGTIDVVHRADRKHDARKRKSTVRLSIIDSFDARPNSRTETPQFVKIALRRARLRPDSGRHSPTAKVIRLATENDTKEAHTVLQDWYEGRLAPRPERTVDANVPGGVQSTNPNQSREPEALITISNNARTIEAPFVSSKKKQLGRSLPTTLTRARRPNVKQTRLQPIVTNAPPPDIQSAQKSNTGVVQHFKPSKAPLNAVRLRSAQLETPENEFNRGHRARAFRRRMECLTENVAKDLRQRQPNSTFQMARYLNTFDQQNAEILTDPKSKHQNISNTPRLESNITHRPRKARASRLDAEAREYRQPSNPVPENVDEFECSESFIDQQKPVLQALGAFGSKYSVDFDIRPLEPGTFFQSSTFIGSGDFGDSLRLQSRNLDGHAGRIRVHIDGRVREWSAWTEDVATDFTEIPDAISTSIKVANEQTEPSELVEQSNLSIRNIEHILRSVVRYCSKCLWFVDPIDRQACIESLRCLLVDLNEIGVATKERQLTRISASVWQYAFIIANQALQLCGHTLVLSETEQTVRDVALSTANALLKHVIQKGLEDLRSFYDDNRRASKREAGISDDAWPVSSLLILHHVFQNPALPRSSFWQMVNKAINVDTTQMNNVAEFERLWYSLFTILPITQVDVSGIVYPVTKHVYSREDWSLVRGLVTRVLDLYEASSQVRGLTANDYVRAVLSRCYHLVNKWKWWHCEQILGSIYDFFARRGLALLRNEESKGSPEFLNELESRPSLDLEPDDRAFHVFLKLLATGLQGMQQNGIYANRKIGSIAWRFIPSHGRTYRKDRELQKSDLDALRNHFDLLCTLYFASPPEHRLQVELFQNLVDHTTSHREACRLSIRAWTNVTSFQASTDEPINQLEQLTEWFHDMLKTTLAQYRLAKSEAEQDFADARERGVNGITEDIFDSTVARNQRQIAASLVEAVAGLKRALCAATKLSVWVALIQQSMFWMVLEAFTLSQRRLTGAAIEALNVVEKALAVDHNVGPGRKGQQDSEDSQDFGDDAALSAFVLTENQPDASDFSVSEVLQEHVAHFVSNVFGSEEVAEDSLLQKTIDVWTQLIRNAVQTRKSSWMSYVDDYSAHSWLQLRDTTHKRKFAPYFMARMVEYASQDEDIWQRALVLWMSCLVEREALLKYQHVLTYTLLNHCAHEHLVHNLPFIMDQRTKRYDITLNEIRQRRLHLVSCVLSNMRISFEDAIQGSLETAQELRTTYTEIIRHLTQSMKSNYQELQTHRNAEVADMNAQGAYVEFVQRVVSFLQQHTTGICPVDRFFTDSAAFPLPTADPTYVASKLRSYVPRLSESKTRKELAVFIQSVGERASIDGQQQYLVNQISSAVEGVRERGDVRASSLRYVLLTSIFPAYIDNSLSSTCCWILALPLLQACEQILSDLIYDIAIEDERGVNAVTSIITAMLHDLSCQWNHALSDPRVFELPSSLKIMTAMFRVAKSSLTTTSWIFRCTKKANEIVNRVDLIRKQALQIEKKLANELETEMVDMGPPVPACSWADTKLFAEKQIRDSINANWNVRGGKYFVLRGNAPKQVVVDLDNTEQEKARLLQVIDDFCNAHDAIFDHRRRKQLAADDDSCETGSVMV